LGPEGANHAHACKYDDDDDGDDDDAGNELLELVEMNEEKLHDLRP
jgi:hypothetical protein